MNDSVDDFREIRCYIEEYERVPGVPSTLSTRLREKEADRKFEVGRSESDGGNLQRIRAGPRAQGLAANIPNVYESSGYDDYVLVSGTAEIDTVDLIRLY